MRTLKKAFLREFPFFIAVPALVWQCCFFYVPLVVVLFFSVLSRSVIPTTMPAPIVTVSNFFTLEHFSTVMTWVHFRIIFRSLLIALSTASLCLLCAYPLAYFIVFRAKKFKNLLLFMVILPLWTNLIVLAYAWFFVLEKYGIINTLLLKLHLINEPLQLLNTPYAVLLVMLYCYLPFMVMPLYTMLEKLDARLIEASLDLGATPFQTFFKVIVPLTSSGIRTGFFLVFIPSFGEFVIPALLGGSKQFFVGSLISQYFLLSRDVYVGSAFTCLSSVVLVITAILLYRGIGAVINWLK